MILHSILFAETRN